MVTNFFLGANSGAGFQSLYEDFVSPEKNYDVMLLKGGPGVGKSSFMKHIARQAEAAGEDVECIWCSGDPDSLDGVRLPRINVVLVDATAPHGIATKGHQRGDKLRPKTAPPAQENFLRRGRLLAKTEEPLTARRGGSRPRRPGSGGGDRGTGPPPPGW